MSQRRQAFTLVELLVVIGIIALLISILLPALNKVREQGDRVKCSSNMRTLTTAMHMYSDEWKQVVPYNNWLAQEQNNYKAAGWLYDYQIRKVTALRTLQELQGGVLWKFVKNAEIYRCPADAPPYDSDPNAWTRPITSYG